MSEPAPSADEPRQPRAAAVRAGGRGRLHRARRRQGSDPLGAGRAHRPPPGRHPPLRAGRPCRRRAPAVPL